MGGGTSILDANESCFRCHAAQRGPHVFEHEAMREGCAVCHTPHGSVNAKLLTVRNANLCLKCHFQRVSGGTILIGGAMTYTFRLALGKKVGKSLVEADKVDVAFKASERTLVHGRGGGAPAQKPVFSVPQAKISGVADKPLPPQPASEEEDAEEPVPEEESAAEADAEP